MMKLLKLRQDEPEQLTTACAHPVLVNSPSAKFVPFFAAETSKKRLPKPAPEWIITFLLDLAAVGQPLVAKNASDDQNEQLVDAAGRAGAENCPNFGAAQTENSPTERRSTTPAENSPTERRRRSLRRRLPSPPLLLRSDLWRSSGFSPPPPPPRLG